MSDATEQPQEPEKTPLATKTRQMAALTPEELAKRTGMPLATAEVKSEGTKLGWLVTIVGLMMLLGSLVTGLLIVFNKTTISLMVVILVAIPGVVGLVVALVGASMISREASPIVDKLGNIAERLIRARRGGSST